MVITPKFVAMVIFEPAAIGLVFAPVTERLLRIRLAGCFVLCKMLLADAIEAKAALLVSMKPPSVFVER